MAGEAVLRNTLYLKEVWEVSTEWEEELIKHKIIEPREIPKPPTAREYDAQAFENKEILEQEDHERKISEKVDGSGDSDFDDEEDRRALESYRKQRLKEIQDFQASNRFGSITEISESEYKKEINEAGEGLWVIVFFYRAGISSCQLMGEKLRVVALKFKATKFVKIRADDAIKNYPDKNLPTLLVYHNGELKKQFIGLTAFGGESITAETIEWVLYEAGAVDSDMQENPLEQKNFNVKTSSRKLGNVWHDNGSDDD